MSQERRSVLSSEVSTLRQSCNQLEKSMMELQGNLETKNASLASLGNDLKVAEEQYNRLMAKVEEMQNTVSTRDNTGEYVTETRPRETRGGRGRLFSLKRLCFFFGFFYSSGSAPADGDSPEPVPTGSAGAQHAAEPTEDVPG